MRNLVLLAFLALLLGGCAVVTPYGTEIYAPAPVIAIDPCPGGYYGYYSYPYAYYGYGYYYQGGYCGW